MNTLKYLPLLVLSVVLAGCGEDINQHRERVQEDNDNNNRTGNKAMCLALGDISRAMYPYTVKYIEGQIDQNNPWDPIEMNNLLNLRLSLYTKAGLLSEELVGEDNGKPLYRYQFTDEGNKYAHWWGGGTTYFCFGRVVVDNITAIDKLSGNIIITYNMHYENIPDWLKSPDIYNQYWQIGGEKAVTGQQILGASTYSLDYEGKLGRVKTLSSGRYVL